MKKIIITITVLFLSTVSIQIQAACSRDELQSSVDSYLSAQTSGNISKMPLAAEAKYFENMEAVKKEDGLWNTALPIAHSKSFIDPVRCKSFTEVIVTEGGHQYVIGTRLTVSEGVITTIDSLVTDKGDWLFNADAYLKFSKAEDWGVLPVEQRVPAQDLIDAANQYLDMFQDKFVKAPWGTPCARLEGGAYTNWDNKPDSETTCKVGVPDGVLYIVNRSFVIDQEKGVINVFCRFGSSTGMPDSHTFRLVNGKYRSIHTLSVNMNPDVPSPQATAEGRMVRLPQQ